MFFCREVNGFQVTFEKVSDGDWAWYQADPNSDLARGPVFNGFATIEDAYRDACSRTFDASLELTKLR